MFSVSMLLKYETPTTALIRREVYEISMNKRSIVNFNVHCTYKPKCLCTLPLVCSALACDWNKLSYSCSRSFLVDPCSLDKLESKRMDGWSNQSSL